MGQRRRALRATVHRLIADRGRDTDRSQAGREHAALSSRSRRSRSTRRSPARRRLPRRPASSGLFVAGDPAELTSRDHGWLVQHVERGIGLHVLKLRSGRDASAAVLASKMYAAVVGWAGAMLTIAVSSALVAVLTVIWWVMPTPPSPAPAITACHVAILAARCAATSRAAVGSCSPGRGRRWVSRSQLAGDLVSASGSGGNPNPRPQVGRPLASPAAGLCRRHVTGVRGDAEASASAS